MDRAYYSQRAGRSKGSARLTLDDLKRFFKTQFDQFESSGFFQEHLGYHCVDSGFSPGLLGTDIQTELSLVLGKSNLWPVDSTIDDWSEDDFFDMVEFLYDHASKPTQSYFHEYGGCGLHCSAFDRESGQDEYRQKFNRLLQRYDSGFELSEKGEVLALSPTGLEPLADAPLPRLDPDNVTARVEAASQKFRRHRSSIEDRRDAVRDLADVLEYLRPKLKKVLAHQDEQDLFNIANNFGIRHHREGQKVEYDRAIWLSWLYYFYLATIHAAVRLIEKAGETP